MQAGKPIENASWEALRECKLRCASQREAVIIAQGETLGMRFRRMNPPRRGGASLFAISTDILAIAQAYRPGRSRIW
jgi:hypothetical protein